MATNYADKRGRYRDVFPWDAANIVSSTPATRGPAPRDNFRVVTADVPKLDEKEWQQQLDGKWAKKPPETLKPESGGQTATADAAPASEAPNAADSASAALPAASSSLI